MTTTTITPKGKTMITLEATLTSPFHHGAGTAGNTSLLRTQDVVQPDGTIARVPFLSAASVRHALRDAIAWHTARTIGWEPGSLSKTLVDLLWTGGAVTSTGSRTNLEMIRRVEDIYPALNLLGFAAQSDIVTGTLRASDMILACEENDHRLPTSLRGRRRAAHYRTEEFGTRHDQATSPAGRYLALADEHSTAQMIWDTQVLATGSTLHGTLSLTAGATAAHEKVLYAALALWAPDGATHLGAKTAQGYGQATIYGIDYSYAEDALEWWTSHITTHASDVTDLLTEITQ